MKKGVGALAEEDVDDQRRAAGVARRNGLSRSLIICVFAVGVLLLYALTMPLEFPPDADAIRWAQWVESPRPVWESRHLLAWSLERTCLQLWHTFGYQGKAFVPMQFTHAALAALALASVLWLLMARGVGWPHAVMLGLIIAFSYAWFQYARNAHVRIPSVTFGVLAVVLALGVSQTQLRRLRTAAIIVTLSALAVLLQINGVVFVPVVAAAAALRLGGRPVIALGRGIGISAVALLLTAVVYGAAWSWGVAGGQYPTMVAWITEHPEQKALDAGISLQQALRTGAGFIQALGGESAVFKSAKALLVGSSQNAAVTAADWVAFSGGIIALLLGCIAAVSCAVRETTRVEGITAALVVAITAGFALVWTGSDAWLWLAPVAFLWYVISLYACRSARGGRRTTAVLAIVVVLSAAGAYRQIEAPCLLTHRASAPVRSAMAYARQTAPGDVAVGFWGWTDWLDYGLGRDRLYLYHLSFGRDWRWELKDGLQRVAPAGRIFVTADVVEPAGIDTVEMWERVEKANGMARVEVLRVLRQAGELVRIDGMLPDEPIWELKRKSPE